MLQHITSLKLSGRKSKITRNAIKLEGLRVPNRELLCDGVGVARASLRELGLSSQQANHSGAECLNFNHSGNKS